MGCQSVGGEEARERERFIEAYIEVGRVEGDPVRRDSILSEHGLTVEEMLAFVDRHGRDPARLAELWEEIRERAGSEPISPAHDGDPAHLDRESGSLYPTRDPVIVVDEPIRPPAETLPTEPDDPILDPSGDAPLDPSETQLAPEGIEEGLSGEPDDS